MAVKQNTEASDAVRDTDSLAEVETAIRDLILRLAEAERARTDVERSRFEETRRLLLGIAELGDALDRIFAAARAKGDSLDPSARRWIASFRGVRRGVQQLLTDHGAIEIESIDRSFDPHWHTVVEVVLEPTHEEGTVVEEVHKGYVWRSTILRKAGVVIVGTDQHRL